MELIITEDSTKILIGSSNIEKIIESYLSRKNLGFLFESYFSSECLLNSKYTVLISNSVVKLYNYKRVPLKAFTFAGERFFKDPGSRKNERNLQK
jgi:hypothetical protein